MKIVVIGSGGQLGTCIARDWADRSFHGELESNEYYFLKHKDIDITSKESISYTLGNIRPDIVINCAAYTNVDAAEVYEDKAMSVNFDGARYLAEYCGKNDIFLFHISTDFVFDGNNEKVPYLSTNSINPLSVYGKSKALGETAVRILCDRSIIIRTSWLYSEYGNNFAKTMLSRIDVKIETKVVDDQIGSPTYAMHLAKFINNLISTKTYEESIGIIHFSDIGETSWYGLAKEIELLAKGEDQGIIRPCSTEEYISDCNKIVATRPKYSVMNNFETINYSRDYISWKSGLKEWLYEMSKWTN